QHAPDRFIVLVHVSLTLFLKLGYHRSPYRCADLAAPLGKRDFAPGSATFGDALVVHEPALFKPSGNLLNLTPRQSTHRNHLRIKERESAPACPKMADYQF